MLSVIILEKLNTFIGSFPGIKLKPSLTVQLRNSSENIKSQFTSIFICAILLLGLKI